MNSDLAKINALECFFIFMPLISDMLEGKIEESVLLTKYETLKENIKNEMKK